MAEKKKKGIYSRKLKDINKDGKRNFKDTFLGDLLGVDGKAGIQKGRPGLKASLKGARREDGKADTTAKKVQKAKKEGTPTSRLDRKGATPKKAGKLTSVLDRKGETPKRKAQLSPRLDRKGATPDTSTKSNRLDSKNSTGLKVTYNQWKGMTRQQRIDRGLPTSVVGGELGFKRWKTGITGKESTMTAGMSKGGMAKKKAGYSKGGMTKRSGYNKGGSVSNSRTPSNCGASMKPNGAARGRSGK